MQVPNQILGCPLVRVQRPDTPLRASLLRYPPGNSLAQKPLAFIVLAIRTRSPLIRDSSRSRVAASASIMSDMSLTALRHSLSPVGLGLGMYLA